MKVKYLSAAIAALCSTAALAAPAAQFDPTNAGFVAPDAAHTIYISGASAQQNPLETVLKTVGNVFATAANITKVSASAGGSFAYVGDYAADPTKTIAVIYNGTNGSAAGLNQLLSVGTGENESVVVKLTNGATNGCGTLTVGTPNTVTCTQTGARETDMALSDVYATEFGSSGSLCSGPLTPYASPICINTPYLTTAQIKSPIAANSTGLEGFGVIVNDTAYNTLLARNIAEGILPASCSTATVTRGVANPATAGTCQPSIRRGDYAVMATKNAGWDSFAIDNVGGVPTQIHRRDEFSGTQAASNIFFLNNVCGLKGYGGFSTPARAADSGVAPNPATLTWFEQPGTGNVESGVAAAPVGTNALGVVSSNRADHADSSTKNWWFVKIDGVSPNYRPDGTYGSLGTVTSSKRANLLNGSYTFAVEMAAYVRNTIATDNPIAAAVTTTIANGLASAAVTPAGLDGIGYLDAPLSWPDGVQSKFSRGGNNCAPLH